MTRRIRQRTASGRKLRRRAGAAFARDAAAIALTAPQVIAHRMARMARAGALPSLDDRREFTRMGAEKVAAFYDAWTAMAMQGWRIQQEMWAASLRAVGFPSLWFPWQSRGFDPARGMAALQSATTRVLAAGLVPVRKRTVANARRLGRPGVARRRGR